MKIFASRKKLHTFTRSMVIGTVIGVFLFSNYLLVRSQNGSSDLKGQTQQVTAIANRNVDAGQIFFKKDTDHDGMADDDEVRNGLDPDNPTDADGDLDGDGLSNADELETGTNLNATDSDGDGVSDAEEVRLGFNPTDPNSRPPAGASLVGIQVTPGTVGLNVNNLLGVSPAQLTVTGTLSDGSSVNLTTALGTSYQSLNAAVAVVDAGGMVAAAGPGSTSIVVSNGGFTAQTSASVSNVTVRMLSFISIPGFANNVDVFENHAYVAAGATGLQVVDVSNRFAPRIVAALDTPGNANDVKVVGNLAYVADGVSGLRIINISIPTNPILAGVLDTPGEAYDVTISGARAFVADGSSGLSIIDVSNPQNPTLLGAIDIPGTAKGVDVTGNLAVVASGNSGIRIINISNPAVPLSLGALASAEARDVTVDGNTAYLADFSGGFKVVDLTSPSAPRLLGSLSISQGGILNDVAKSRNFVLGADINFVNSVPIIDVQNPSNPFVHGTIDFPVSDDNGTGIAVDDQFVYLTADREPFVENGATGASHLYIGHYFVPNDTVGSAPAVTITEPQNGATILASGVTLKAAASDDVFVTSVEFMVNGLTVGIDNEAPFEVHFVPPPGAVLTISAVAKDQAGLTGTAPPVVVNVNDVPVLNITTPQEGAQVIRGHQVEVIAEASDQNGIAQVEFTVQGDVILSSFPPITAPPYRIVILTTSDNTNVTIQATATDNLGDTTTVTRRVIGVPSPPPTIAITSPAEGTQLIEGQPVQVAAFVSDDMPGSDVDFTVNGVSLPTDFDPPYVAFLTVPVGAASFTVQARATDFFGNQSPTVSRTVAVVENQPPTVSLTQPSESAQLLDGETIELSADAADDVGVTSVVFTVDDVDLSPDFDAPYSVLYTIPIGATSLTVKATAFDDLGRTATEMRTFSVSPNPANQAPIVTLTSPAAGTQWVEGQTVEISADAAGINELEIDRVVFAVNGMSLPTDRRAPYKQGFTVPLGVTSLNIQATATDTAGQSTTVNQTVSVVPDTRTTVRGRMVDRQGNPVAGASVAVKLNGLKGEFFNFDSPINSMPDLNGLTPDVTKLISTINFRNPNNLFNADTFGVGLAPNFAARFSGLIDLAEGLYTFTLRANDGARMKIDGQVIVEVSGTGEFTEATGEYQFDASQPVQAVEIEYFQNDGDAELQLLVTNNGIFGFAGFRPLVSIPFSERMIVPQTALLVSPDAFTATTDASGLFVIPNIPAALGRFTLEARATAGSRKLAGHLSNVQPVLGGLVEVGDIVLKPAVGYYDLWRSISNETQAGPIAAAGMEPINVGNLDNADLSQFDILFVQNSRPFGYTQQYVNNLQKISDFVSAGGVLVFHDGTVDMAATVLPGNPGTIIADRTDVANINIVDSGTKVTSGPGGILTDTSLDVPETGGDLASVGYIDVASLPAGARGILSRSNPAELVLYSYPFGQGQVIYSTIPLSIYLIGVFVPEEIVVNFRDIYAPNVLGYADDLRGEVAGMNLPISLQGRSANKLNRKAPPGAGGPRPPVRYGSRKANRHLVLQKSGH